MTIDSLATSLIVRPGLIVVGTLIVTRLLRRRSAAARHAVWAGSIGALLSLPLLTSVLPPLRIGSFVDAMPAVVQAIALNGQRAPNGQINHAPSIGTSSTNGARADDAFVSLGQALVSLWAVVAVILVARRLTAELLVRRLVGRGRPDSGMLSERCGMIAGTLGIRRSVALTISDETASPAVVGLFRPTLILPVSVNAWTSAETTSVLLHELSHVARRDCAMNFVSDLAAAAYWCNPMVYIAAQRLRAEAERACDDEVLYAGGEPKAYALLLLEFARATRMTATLPRSASAMSRPSELESRMMAVLDARVPRAPLRRSVVCALAAVSTVLALPIAATTLSASVAVPVADVTGLEPDRLGDSLAAQPSERLPIALSDAAIDAAARRAFSGPDSALAAVLLAAVRAAPNDSRSLVRERAAWALVQTRGNRLIDPVLETLDSDDWRVQAYAAWTAGVAGDHRAVPKLILLMRHRVWRVRAMAAAVLRQLADPRSADVMTIALADQAWQVRIESVEYLGALGDPSHRELLRARLNDRHVAVRQSAARALNIH
jgi:beta-lactamase regulating signal transducer with metallopeptidase domain